jgi:hypothetical protein
MDGKGTLVNEVDCITRVNCIVLGRKKLHIIAHKSYLHKRAFSFAPRIFYYLTLVTLFFWCMLQNLETFLQPSLGIS